MKICKKLCIEKIYTLARERCKQAVLSVSILFSERSLDLYGINGDVFGQINSPYSERHTGRSSGQNGCVDSQSFKLFEGQTKNYASRLNLTFIATNNPKT